MEVKCFDGITDDVILVRQEVFVDEQGFEEEFDSIDKNAFFVVVYDGAVPVATGRMFSNEEGTYKIGRVAVRKTYRKMDIGRRVMEELENAAREKGATKVELSSQMSAKGFYEKNGYYAYGDEYLDQFCPHIAMVKEL